METIWEWAARSFTSPADLSAIELLATAAVVTWGGAMLAAVRHLGQTPVRGVEAGEEYDEAA